MKFVSYLRVSTDRQGRSGLGLDAQRKAVEDYVERSGGSVVREVVEVESGKKNDRPGLREALTLCENHRATLLVAKLDRLARSVAFVSSVMESSVDFVAVDFPTANRLTIHILAAVAEHEREMISQRTKAALAAAKERGIKLGTPANLTAEGRKKGVNIAAQVNRGRATAFKERVLPIVKQAHNETGSYRATAKALNQSGVVSASGRLAWTAESVRRVLNGTN